MDITQPAAGEEEDSVGRRTNLNVRDKDRDGHELVNTTYPLCVYVFV